MTTELEALALAESQQSDFSAVGLATDAPADPGPAWAVIRHPKARAALALVAGSACSETFRVRAGQLDSEASLARLPVQRGRAVVSPAAAADSDVAMIGAAKTRMAELVRRTPESELEMYFTVSPDSGDPLSWPAAGRMMNHFDDAIPPQPGTHFMMSQLKRINPIKLFEKAEGN